MVITPSDRADRRRVFIHVKAHITPYIATQALKAATLEGSLAELPLELLVAHRKPLLGCDGTGIELGIELGRSMQGRTAIVGTDILALVATEDPAIKVKPSIGLALDRAAGDTA